MQTELPHNQRHRFLIEGLLSVLQAKIILAVTTPPLRLCHIITLDIVILTLYYAI